MGASQDTSKINSEKKEEGMKSKSGSQGFTLIELLIVFGIISIVVVGIGMIGMGIKGNYWWTQTGVVSQLQEEYPDVEKMIVSKSERNIFRESRITVIQNGQPVTYCLDSDIFFDYQFTDCKQ
jgi:prepilin-type N-terminal cleavage/methylation domain-containing protein